MINDHKGTGEKKILGCENYLSKKSLFTYRPNLSREGVIFKIAI